jgi:glycosyltransferase involved in cell wall biosynthesis
MPFKNEKNINLSILILSIPSRLDKLTTLLHKLETQIKHRPEKVEILCLLDNKSKHIADKRNDLLNAASGKYIVFLDDDDDISDDYITSLVDIIDEYPNTDIITFNQRCLIDGRKMNVSFGMNNPTEHPYVMPDGNLSDILRPPFHICVWKTDIAKTEEFERIYDANGQSGEDHHWCKKLYPKIKTEYKINKQLHHYIYDSTTTESILK